MASPFALPIMDSDSSLSDLSSDLSSIRSVSPPSDYPTPLSTQEPDVQKPAAKKRGLEDEGVEAPPKRRRTEPKPRTTSYLDLTKDATHIRTEQKAQLDLLLKVLRKRRKIVVVAGAGISVSAGSKYNSARAGSLAL